MVETSNVSSQGAIGLEALRRSNNVNRSRDSIYNQAKSYSELYRSLGWMASVGKALLFRMTALGDHVAAPGDQRELVAQSFLAMTFPNSGSKVKGNQNVRPFATTIKALASLGSLSRDEIIAGPMCITNDSSKFLIDHMVDDIAQMRKSAGALDERLDGISKARGISRNPTMTNYVRIPMAFPQWAGFATKDKKGSLIINEAGIKAAQILESRNDLRRDQYDALPECTRSTIVFLSHFRMLEEAGFNLEDYLPLVLSAEEALRADGILLPLHFSPFQQLPAEEIYKLHPDLHPEITIDMPSVVDVNEISTSDEIHDISDAPYYPTRVLISSLAGETKDHARAEAVRTEIRSAIDKFGGNIDDAVKFIHSAHRLDQQTKFYPLVADLLSISGFDCEVNQPGRNSSREDALIKDERFSMPIEIKSPTEELEISIKGIRQALENKIIMLARDGSPYPTTRETTSLVVGYNKPQDRTEVRELIENIYFSYDINIGVISFEMLVRIAVQSMLAASPLDLSNLYQFRGILDVEFA